MPEPSNLSVKDSDLAQRQIAEPPASHSIQSAQANTIRSTNFVATSHQVEVVGAQQTEIHRALAEGGFDLGLVNHLDGDDMPAGFETTELLRGRPVVCVRPDSPPAAWSAVSPADLLEGREPPIAMRSGYAMHRCLHRFLEGRDPSPSYSTIGAEMGKPMVTEGLGATVLPDFRVIGHPPARCGALTHRPLTVGTTRVRLMLRRRRADSVPRAAGDPHHAFVRGSAELGGDPAATARAGGDRPGAPCCDHPKSHSFDGSA